MSTCPRCYEYLDEGHVCHGRFTRRLVRLIKGTIIGIAGFVFGSVILGTVGSFLGLTGLSLLGGIVGLMTAGLAMYTLRPDRG